MYASEYSYLWLVQSREKELAVQLERRRIALERQQEERERAGSSGPETWPSRALRSIRAHSHRVMAVHAAPRR